MNSKEIDAHLCFLRNYAIKHGIIFRISRTTARIEVLNKTPQQSLNKGVNQ